MKHALTPFYKPYGGRKRAYVSGPMTGFVDDNEAAFAEATQALRDRGYSVCSPAETSEWLGKDLTHEEFLRFDFERVLEADFLVALPGWEHSLGALAELLVATRIGIKVWTWEGFERYEIITYPQVVEALAGHHSHAPGPPAHAYDTPRLRLLRASHPEIYPKDTP